MLIDIHRYLTHVYYIKEKKMPVTFLGNEVTEKIKIMSPSLFGRYLMYILAVQGITSPGITLNLQNIKTTNPFKK